jgi:hypothetical protein
MLGIESHLSILPEVSTLNIGSPVVPPTLTIVPMLFGFQTYSN